MDADEIKALDLRLAAGKRLVDRIKNLRDASDRLTRSEVESIQIGLHGDSPQVLWRASSTDKFSAICWSRDLEGIGQELRVAVLTVLDRHIEQATREFANL